MSKDEKAVEAEINEKGLTAPRVTPEMLDAEITAFLICSKCGKRTSAD